ncbi:uncharacterized protein LOC116240232 [Phasianus colchicus]|uniref:uncharacterized protein LOC116240232 n=1 Tax=Phasianus colchicus TaxID=9054 RepID=UPI00129ECDEF|nr:uncharacterized protein LOC116240232 [Phasianus colchicus]
MLRLGACRAALRAAWSPAIPCEVTLRCDVTVVPRAPSWQRWERWLSPLVGPAGSGTRESVASTWRFPAVMERLRALRGLFACVGCVPRRTRRRERSRVPSPVPACAVTSLLRRLQDREGDRAQAYRELEGALWEDDSRPLCGVVNRLLAEVSQDLTAAQVRGHSRWQREPLPTLAFCWQTAMAQPFPGPRAISCASFLYKALGTVLGACKGILHVQEKLLQHLEEANAEDPCEAQGMVSLLSHVAESNFQAVLAMLTTFASRLCKGRNARISRRKKMELDSTRAQATRSALVLAHGSLALRASKEQLLAHLEGDIVGNILMLYSCSCRDLQNNLALVQSITDFSSAFQAVVGDSACFNPFLKGKLLEILMDLLKKYYSGIPVSPVPLKVVLALEQLSKLKPCFESKDMREMLVLCCKNIVTHPSAEMMLKIRKSQHAAQYLQLQQTSLKALGQLMVVLLETEPTGSFFHNIVHVSRCGAREKAWCLSIVGAEIWGLRG